MLGPFCAQCFISTWDSKLLTSLHGFRFLLHYVARDEVALFKRGTGGVPEVRNAIEGYEECSPLYGFLQYRRRKVIIRYMPEGLSRLILGTPIQVPSHDIDLIHPSSK